MTLGCKNLNHSCKHCPASRIDMLASIAKKSIDSMVHKLDKFALVTPSQWLMNELSGAPIYKAAPIRRVIANPSSARRDDFNISRNQSGEVFNILYVAASLDSPYKGFDLFMDSLSLINSSSKLAVKLKIQVVGRGGKRSYQRLAPNMDISHLGQLDSSKVHNLMRHADLLVVPSLSENYPGVVAEAQILKCVVAASRVGGIPEMIEDGVTGFLFEPTPLGCMTAIIRAIDSPNRIRIQAAARQLAVKRHDEGKINSEYNEVILELMNS